jgi:hypothetical protein
MHPHFLLRTSAVGANSQNVLHLRIAHKQDVSRNEEPDTFAARRASQTATVSPHLPEIAGLAESHGRCRSTIQTLLPWPDEAQTLHSSGG